MFALLVPSCCDKSGTSCYHLVTRLMTVTDLLQVVPTRLIQAVRNKLLRACCRQLVTCRRYQTCWNNLLRVCWPHQPCYKMITTCSRLGNNWEQAMRTDILLTSCEINKRAWTSRKNSLELIELSSINKVIGRGPLAKIISVRGNLLGNRFSVVQCIVP